MGTTIVNWFLCIGGFAATSAVVQYGFGGTLLGGPTWAWGLMGGIGVGLALLNHVVPASLEFLMKNWREHVGR